MLYNRLKYQKSQVFVLNLPRSKKTQSRIITKSSEFRVAKKLPNSFRNFIRGIQRILTRRGVRGVEGVGYSPRDSDRAQSNSKRTDSPRLASTRGGLSKFMFPLHFGQKIYNKIYASEFCLSSLASCSLDE